MSSFGPTLDNIFDMFNIERRLIVTFANLSQDIGFCFYNPKVEY